MVMEDVKRSRTPSGEMTANNYPAGKGVYKSVTGREYVFIEQPSPKFMQDRGEFTSFSPTQIKNYPMQGFATGDIVPEILGRMHYALAQNNTLWNKFIPINTIHDSIIFDTPPELLDAGCNLVYTIMTDAPYWMKERFGLEIDLPLGVDIEHGPTWRDIETWKGK